jgi:hypothetical protein
MYFAVSFIILGVLLFVCYSTILYRLARSGAEIDFLKLRLRFISDLRDYRQISKKSGLKFDIIFYLFVVSCALLPVCFFGAIFNILVFSPNLSK